MDTLELGGNIQLTGFSDLKRDQMVVVKKIVGSYGRKFSDRASSFEQLCVSMKPVHDTGSSKQYELHAKLMDNGTPIVGEVTERNLFIALDLVLKKVENGMN